MPWELGKRGLTQAYVWFLRRLCWKEVPVAFRTSWESVFRSAAWAVASGRARQDLVGIRAVWVYEISWSKGHRYLTPV